MGGKLIENGAIIKELISQLFKNKSPFVSRQH